MAKLPCNDGFGGVSPAPTFERMNTMTDNRGGPGLGDDVPCSKCGAVALDTGLECTECGHDMRPEIDGQTIAVLRDVADAVCKQFSAAGIAPVIGSPNPAEDLHARAVLALGGKVAREHVASAACWCQPETDYVDPPTGAAVYVHRQVQ